MIYYKDAIYNIKPKLVKRKGKFYDDNIYTFDIETTSIIRNPKTGNVFLYDKTKDPDYYKDMEKKAFPY